MAGNAAGAALARARKAQREAARRAELRIAAGIERPADQPQQDQPGEQVADVFQPVEQVAPVALVPASGNQTLAVQLIQAGTVQAAEFLNRTVRNAKVSVSLRLQAACKVLEFAGMGQQSAQQSAGDEHVVMLGKLAQALGAQLPRRPVTIEAEPVKREESPVAAPSFTLSEYRIDSPVRAGQLAG